MKYPNIEPEVMLSEDGGLLIIFENESKEITLTIPVDGSIIYFTMIDSKYRKVDKISKDNSITDLLNWLNE